MDGEQLDEKMISRLNSLNLIAQKRGQTLSQMALLWVLHNPAVTTVLIGTSCPEQIAENAVCIENTEFSDEETAEPEALIE